TAPARPAAAVTDRPTRFKRPVLLIVGCGDIGLRVVRLLAGRWRVLALTSSSARVAELRAAGALPLRGDLDEPASLARLAPLAAALHRGRPQRVVNVADDSDLKMGDYFDLVADRFAMARPPRLARAAAAAVLSPVQMSFLGESRRLVNSRLKAELRLVLRYPTVDAGLGPAASAPRE